MTSERAQPIEAGSQTETEPSGQPAIQSQEQPATESVLFDAVLLPHRSLSPVGFTILMGLIACVSFGAGLAFYLIGAWPVVGFMGIDVVLVYVAFRVSFRRARAYETVRLTENTLTVVRVAPSGRRRSIKLQPYWLRVEFEDPETQHGQLWLTSHGKGIIIGRFLHPEQRRSLARDLRAALERLRNPVYG
jgi:uncharacterized membrane protein